MGRAGVCLCVSLFTSCTSRHLHLPSQQMDAPSTQVQTHRRRGTFEEKALGRHLAEITQDIFYNLRNKVIKAKPWLIASPRTTTLHSASLSSS